MELRLVRTTLDASSTEGQLLETNSPVFWCFTLELPFTDGNLGAIPEGRFQVVLAPSPLFEGDLDPWVQRYAKAMPHLADVPGRSHIMVHWGNVAKDTLGCILVGLTKGVDFIGSSRVAFEKIYPLIVEAVNSDSGCWIIVETSKGIS